MEVGTNGRTIAIGDVHGCLEELQELLEKLKYLPQIDRLIFVGDLIDRGPDPAGVVKFCRERDLECTMGNHEYQFLRWYKGNKHLSNRKGYEEFTDEDVSYINRMPYSLKVRDDLWVVHAGVKPNIPLEKQSKDDMIFLRYTDKDRNFISLRQIAKGKGAGAMFWTEFWTGPASVVYGHNVHSETDPMIVEVSPGVKTYGIDTGCCFGGRLTALIVETEEIVQVQAKKIYYKSDL